jgi:glycosyltransferase involved in cell wall biosynthesis
MKIALLTNVLHPYRIPVLRELAKRCDELRVFVSGDTAPVDGLRIVRQKSLHWGEAWRHTHQFTDRLTIHFPYDTLPRLREFQPEVIISGELGLRTLQAALYRNHMPESRLVIWATLSEYTEQGRGALRPILRRALLRTADSVLVNGASGFRYIRGFGAPAEKIFRVPQTTDLSASFALPSARSQSARRRFLYVGRLIELKGILPVLQHFAAWAAAHPEKNIVISFAGDGPLRDQISTYPTPPNLDLRMLGFVDYSRLPEVYQDHGILLFPTLADEWGMVAVEAMAAGLPILGSIYSQAVEDLVDPGTHGWVFRPDHAGDASQAVSAALETPCHVLDEMGAAARAKVRALTPAAMASSMMDAVNYAVGHPIGALA